MNRVKEFRELKNLTQTALAEKAGVSLRTVQRIESGGPLKGFSLNAIADALDIAPENLQNNTEIIPDTERAKLINFSALGGLIIPYGGIIFPLILTSKTKENFNRKIGKSIVSNQIILTTIFSIILIALPFIQKYFSIKSPLFLYAILVFLSLKLTIVIVNGICLNKKNELHKYLKTNFL